MEEGRSAFKISTGKPSRKKPLGVLGVDGRTILKLTLKKYIPIVDLAQDMYYWRTLVNAAMNLRIS